MNKYQEALNTIKFMCIGEASTEFDFDTGLPIPREVYIEDYFVEECRLLQELVDKETPLNLQLHHGVYMQCKCEAMNEVHNNYCWNCGQHIKWSEDE